ncbi:MAG: adenosylmethionine--8-amino-7-oxononanoate transaminase [Bacteroidota bacterium]
MAEANTLIERDLRHVWHPYTHMKTANPLPVVSARGSHYTLADGRTLLDGISSWWVNTHGHCHPHIAEAIAKQAHTLEQCIFANTTHPQAVELAERMLGHAGPNFSRVFFSDDGSTSVEVALKLVIQHFHNQGRKRLRFLAFEDAYHGDTFGAMSASGRGVFTAAFHDLLFDVIFIERPTNDRATNTIDQIDHALDRGPIAGMILEPLIQGAAGMQMYAPQALTRIVKHVQRHKGIVIFDEVMTGFGRTGTLFAMHQLDPDLECQPDIACFSKGLTGGFLPLGLTLVSDEIYQAFVQDDHRKSFFHGHSFTANAISCAAANASLDLFESAESQHDRQRLARRLQAFRLSLPANAPWLKEKRQTGCVLALELNDTNAGYTSNLAPRLTQAFIDRGILLRPLGNVLYILPPYCITDNELDGVFSAVREVVAEVMEVAG